MMSDKKPSQQREPYKDIIILIALTVFCSLCAFIVAGAPIVDFFFGEESQSWDVTIETDYDGQSDEIEATVIRNANAKLLASGDPLTSSSRLDIVSSAGGVGSYTLDVNSNGVVRIFAISGEEVKIVSTISVDNSSKNS